MKKDIYKFTAYETSEMIDAYGDTEKALDGAIDQARERARLYVIPCQWNAFYNDDDGITVERYRK